MVDEESGGGWVMVQGVGRRKKVTERRSEEKARNWDGGNSWATERGR